MDATYYLEHKPGPRAKWRRCSERPRTFAEAFELGYEMDEQGGSVVRVVRADGRVAAQNVGGRWTDLRHER